MCNIGLFLNPRSRGVSDKIKWAREVLPQVTVSDEKREKFDPEKDRISDVLVEKFDPNLKTVFVVPSQTKAYDSLRIMTDAEEFEELLQTLTFGGSRLNLLNKVFVVRSSSIEGLVSPISIEEFLRKTRTDEGIKLERVIAKAKAEGYTPALPPIEA